MHRRGNKRNTINNPVPSEYEMSTSTSNNHSGDSQNSNSFLHTKVQEPNVPSNMRITRNTRSRSNGASIPQLRDKEMNKDSTSIISSNTIKKRRGGARTKPAQQIHHLRDKTSLYFAVCNNELSLPDVVDEWIVEYKNNKENALLMLVQFFISASGCKGLVTTEMQVLGHVHIITKMTEEFDGESGEYPLIMTGRQWRKFCSNLCEFIQILVYQCRDSIIYDQFLMDNIIFLLTGLSDSQVRAFRHTATLAAMKLMIALVDVALTVSINLNKTQRKYEAECQKHREEQAVDRLESLMEKQKVLEENLDEMKNMLTYIFKSVFVHRYRDILPEIRAICIAEIGVCMEKFHQNFLDDSYLKYIGWTLYDKVGEVRLKCLQALQPLYASEELKTKLELFTSKFKDRIVAMTLDKEYDVAVQAVKLVISIYKHHREILTHKDCEHIYELVYSRHKAVAQTAGKFVNEQLFTSKEQVEVRTNSDKKRLPNTRYIQDLIVFSIESELHEHAAYLVDSLIETNQMMKDWECMTDLLIEEPGEDEEPLGNEQKTSLIEIMICCIKQSATGEAPIGRGSTRKILSAKESKQAQEDKQRLTEHFIRVLPVLLDKYRVDPEKLANLLSIPQYFDLDIYTKSRQEQNLDYLLNTIHDIVNRSHNTEVLDTAAKSLEYLCVPGSAIFRRCDIARSTLIDSIVIKYNKYITELRYQVDGGEQPSEDDLCNVVVSLKKVAIFYSCHDMNNCEIYDSLLRDIREIRYRLPNEAIKYCINACSISIIWSLNDLVENIDSNSQVEEHCQQLKKRLNEFMDCMCYIVNDYGEVIPVVLKEEAYNTICDLLIFFCGQLTTLENLHLHTLVYKPDQYMQEMLNRFVQQYVFFEEEDDYDEHYRIEELHKKRNFLAAYCKLITYNIIPIKSAADVFKYYVKYYNDFGDIINITIGKAHDINKVICALTMQQSLNILCNEMVSKNNELSRNGKEFTAIKDLAKRFALSFGLDAVKNREAITNLHRQGILFAASSQDGAEVDSTGPPPNLYYLEILNEFTHKLLKQDKKVIISFLDKRFQAGMSLYRDEDWQPLLLYRNDLLRDGGDTVPVTSKRAYTKRKRDLITDEDDAEDV